MVGNWGCENIIEFRIFNIFSHPFYQLNPATIFFSLCVIPFVPVEITSFVNGKQRVTIIEMT